MKIKPEHYEAIRAAFAALPAGRVRGARQTIVMEGRAKDVDKRLRWDMLYICRHMGLLPDRFVVDTLYPYANDDHIDTALKKAFEATHGPHAVTEHGRELTPAELVQAQSLTAEQPATPAQGEQAAPLPVQLLRDIKRYGTKGQRPDGTHPVDDIARTLDAHARTFTAFCVGSDGQGTTWIDVVQADDYNAAIGAAKEACAADWECKPDDVYCIGIAAGDVKILYWQD